MKMTDESYQLIKRDMADNVELIESHRGWLLEDGRYNVFTTRLGWDVYHGIVTKEAKDSVRKESLNDSHITTALVKALKELNIIGGTKL